MVKLLRLLSVVGWRHTRDWEREGALVSVRVVISARSGSEDQSFGPLHRSRGVDDCGIFAPRTHLPHSWWEIGYRQVVCPRLS